MKKNLSGHGPSEPKANRTGKIKTGYIVLGVAALGLAGYQLLKRRDPATNETSIASTDHSPATITPAVIAPPPTPKRPVVTLSFQPPKVAPGGTPKFAPFRIQILNNRKNRSEAELRELAGDLSQLYAAAKVNLINDIDALKNALQGFLDLEESMTSREAFEKVYTQLNMVMDNNTRANITWKYGLEGIDSQTLNGLLSEFPHAVYL